MLQQAQCSLLCGYEMDQLHRTLTLHTYRREEWGITKYRIVFIDVMASWIGNVTDSNTMINIHEIEVGDIWNEGERLFRAHNGELWPLRFRNRREFLQKVRSKFLRSFELLSDSGTAGWVISQDPIVTSVSEKNTERNAGKNK